MVWYDRDKDTTIYQLGLTPAELLNAEHMLKSALDSNRFVGCAAEGANFDRNKKEAEALHKRIKALSDAAESAGRARLVVEAAARGDIA